MNGTRREESNKGLGHWEVIGWWRALVQFGSVKGGAVQCIVVTSWGRIYLEKTLTSYMACFRRAFPYMLLITHSSSPITQSHRFLLWSPWRPMHLPLFAVTVKNSGAKFNWYKGGVPPPARKKEGLFRGIVCVRVQEEVSETKSK